MSVRPSTMMLAAVFTAYLLFLSYFHILYAEYYFPGRYEEAFRATVYSSLVGIPTGLALIFTTFRRLTQGFADAAA